jgi:predicted nuclease with TOPRIM domain
MNIEDLEKRILAVEGSNQELQEKHMQLQQENEDLKAALILSDSPALAQRVEALEGSNQELQLNHVLLQGENEKLKALLASAGTPVEITKPELPTLPAKRIFTVDKVKYELTVPAFDIPGLGYRTASDVMMDLISQKTLVDMKSGVIKQLA